MQEKLEKYLNQVNKKLRPLTLEERLDIIKETKSLITQMQQDNFTEK